MIILDPMKNVILILIVFAIVSCYRSGPQYRINESPESYHELKLNNKGLTGIPVEVGNMVNLEKLVLFRNKIDSIPPVISNLIKLEELSLQSNRLVFVAPEIGVLKRLHKLNLRFNKLESLPEEISGLSELVELDLRNNKLKQLPTELGNLTKLEYLYLNDNNIEELPVSLAKLQNLRLLHIGKNHLLSRLPDFIGDLSSLIELDVAGCGEDFTLPATIGKLKRLEILYVSPYQIIPYGVGKGNSRLKIIVK